MKKKRERKIKKERKRAKMCAPYLGKGKTRRKK